MFSFKTMPSIAVDPWSRLPGFNQSPRHASYVQHSKIQLGFKCLPQSRCILLHSSQFLSTRVYIRRNSCHSRGFIRRKTIPRLACEVERKEDGMAENRGDRLRSWLLRNARKQQQPVGERVMRMVAGASQAPIAQYISSPLTPLHTLDPRVKQAWLLALVVLPARSHMAIRLSMVAFLALATMWALPRRVWQDQLGRMAVLSGLLFVMLALGTDGVPPVVQNRRPLPMTEGLPNLPSALGGYKYVILKLGPLQLTRKGVAVATAASCLSFTVLQSASLCLTTTTPEQLAAALRWYMAPLARVGAPVEELILTLLLSLRFISLVFDEVRNIAVGVVARGIDWKRLRLAETADTFFNLFGRLFKNLFHHAEQISQAMLARGYRGNAAKHRVYFLTKLSIEPKDWAAIAGLIVLIGLSIVIFKKDLDEIEKLASLLVMLAMPSCGLLLVLVKELPTKCKV